MNKKRVSDILEEAARAIREEYGEVGATWLNPRLVNYPIQTTLARLEEGLYRKKMFPLTDLADILEDVASNL